jgi:hypothetical protein
LFLAMSDGFQSQKGERNDKPDHDAPIAAAGMQLKTSPKILHSRTL